MSGRMRLYVCLPELLLCSYSAPDRLRLEPSYAPMGLAHFYFTHGLRRGLYSCAAPRLDLSNLCRGGNYGALKCLPPSRKKREKDGAPAFRKALSLRSYFVYVPLLILTGH